MVAWEVLLSEQDLASVLPARYTPLMRPVREALIVFLSGLPRDRQEQILADQAALSPAVSVSQRLAALARSCPVLHKLAQVLARDERLHPDLRATLCPLESLPPTVPREQIVGVLRSELGASAMDQLDLDSSAIAEASVAVVLPFRLRGAADDSAVEAGVFKVLKPGIERRLETELDQLTRVGAHLDQSCEDLQIPQLAYEDVFRQIRDKLLNEIRLDQEQLHLATAGAMFADEPNIQIPRLFGPCSRRVTAMERVFGCKVTDAGAAGTDTARRIADRITASMIARSVMTSTPSALFHGDPHAGNLYWTDDGRLALLDWSLVGQLTSFQRTTVVQLLLAALTLDASRLTTLLGSLADPLSEWNRQGDEVRLRRVVDRQLRQVRCGLVPGLAWLVELLDDSVQQAGLRVEPDLMLFRKSLHTLDGVLAELGHDRRRTDAILITAFLGQLFRDWPRRLTLSPRSRDLASCLSTLDLSRMAISGPGAALRFWAGHARDLLDAAFPVDTLRNGCSA